MTNDPMKSLRLSIITALASSVPAGLGHIALVDQEVQLRGDGGRRNRFAAPVVGARGRSDLAARRSDDRTPRRPRRHDHAVRRRSRDSIRDARPRLARLERAPSDRGGGPAELSFEQEIRLF